MISIKSTCLHIIYVGLLFTHTNVLQAQEQSIQTERHQVQLEELASEDIQQLYPEARDGVIFRRNREVSRSLNYNVLVRLFYYTDNNGQVNWVEPADADSVKIGETLFLPFGEKGFLQVVPDAENLFIRHLVDIDARTVAKGAYGTTDETASIDVLHGLRKGSEGRSVNHSVMLENPGGQELHIDLERQEHFCLLQDGEPVAINNRRALQRVFPDHRRQIRRYVRRQDIAFDNTEDIRQVLNYIRSL
ncbi:MAG: hypothetical protein R6U62_02825 [Bacteroidales bacterium]